MDAFFEFFALGCDSMFFDHWSQDFDILGALPLEVAIIVLRTLDGKSLLSAAQVCTKWLSIIKFDRALRKTVRTELARQRQEKLKRHMFLSEACNSDLHSTAFFSKSKRPRRQFQHSFSTSKPSKTQAYYTGIVRLKNFR